MPTDFSTDVQDEIPAFPSRADADLGVSGVAIPPETPAPFDVAGFKSEFGANSDNGASSTAFTLPDRKGGAGKKWLAVLILLGLAGGAFVWKQRTQTTRTQMAGAPTTVLAPSTRTQLKKLWREGAQAKQRGDYVRARELWGQGLKLDPGNRGFAESLAKLPRVAANSKGTR